MQGVSLSTTIFAPRGGAAPTMDEVMQRTAAAGFKQVEISRRHGDARAVARAAERHGITVWAVHGTLDGAHICDDEPARRASIMREIARMEEFAVFAPCPWVVHYTNRGHEPRMGTAYRRSLEELALVAARLNITLAVETAPDKPQNPRYPDSREIAGLVRSMGDEYVRMCIDVNHSNLTENLADVARNARGLIANIHVSDNHGVHEDHLLPGRGSIDLPGALRDMRAAGYTGPVNLECHTPEPPTDAELRDARIWAENLLRDMPPRMRG